MKKHKSQSGLGKQQMIFHCKEATEIYVSPQGVTSTDMVLLNSQLDTG